MPTNAVFPDGVPKGVLEAEDFDKDVNPLPLLSHLEEVLSAHLPTLEDSSLITLSEGPLHQELQLDISKTDTSLKSSAKYVMTFMDTLTALSQTLGNVRQKLTDKLDKEFVNFIPGERNMTEEEVRILQHQTQIHKDFADRAAELAALEKLADQIHESTVLLGQEVIRVREEAEQAKAALEEAERQAELRRKEAQEKMEREEAERRAREEQKLKEEEERRRREEESRKHPEEANEQREEERRQRELEEQARNPANWSPFIYTVSEEEDVTGTGLGCVLRVPPGNIEQTDVRISVVDQLNSTFSLGDNEELVSNLINIEVNEGAIYEFPYPPWVAMSNCSPRGLSAREVVIRICTDGQTWTELPTKDAKLPDSPELRLVEGPFTTLCNMTVCAVSKLRIDKEKVSNWGTKLVSSVDSRVSLVIPKGAVRFNSEVSLQVQPVDSTTISHVKANVESMGRLVASSHIVNIQTQGKFQKAATMWMPSPGSSRRPKTSVTPLGQKKASAAQRPSTASGRTKEDKDTVVLVWKRGQGDWQHATGETLTETRDLVSFSLNISQIPTRILLLRMKQVDSQPPLDLAAAARHVQQAVKGKCVNVALRQRTDDMSSIYIEVCKSDKTEKLLHNLTTRGLDSGPQPSEDFLLSEGQVVEVRFRGNITNDDDQLIRFPYNSNLESARCQLFVREVDKFAQHGLDCYRGHAQFLTVAPTPPNTNKAPKTENNEASNETTCPEPPPMKLLTELPITLPKAPMRPPTLNRINVQIEEQGPLTKEYFEALSADLGDEWRQLAEFLGIKPARVESIKREYIESDNKEKVVQDVLMNWYKQTSRNGDKVGELYWALKDTGRVDLSEELLDKNDAFQKQSEMRKEYEKMQKAFKFVTESAVALREWKFLARELRLSEADIEELSHKESSSHREQCYQMLHYWRESSGQKATRKNLARALKACKFLEPAEKIKQIR